MKKGVKLLISIVERGQGKEVIGFYSRYGVTSHFQTVGRGTASSDILDILGVGSTERDVILRGKGADAAALASGPGGGSRNTGEGHCIQYAADGFEYPGSGDVDV